jgi:hypothetical protein
MWAVPGLALVLGLEHAKAGVVLDWTFDGGDLSANRQLGGTATMSYFDRATRRKTTFGNTATSTVGSGVDNMPDGPGNFLHHRPFADGGKGGYQIDYSGIEANGGGDRYVNEYTMIFDIYIPNLAGWTALFNTEPDHDAYYEDGYYEDGDAKFYVTPGGGLWTKYLGESGSGVVSANTWHRIGFVYDYDDSFVRYYVDGVEVFQSEGSEFDGVKDEHYSLYTDDYPHEDGGNDLVIQGEGYRGDDDNYSNEAYLGGFLLADYAFDNSEMSALGGVSKGGFHTPEPTTLAIWLSLGGMGLLAARRRRKRKAS